jgi:hypothetical protein
MVTRGFGWGSIRPSEGGGMELSLRHGRLLTPSRSRAAHGTVSSDHEVEVGEVVDNDDEVR